MQLAVCLGQSISVSGTSYDFYWADTVKIAE